MAWARRAPIVKAVDDTRALREAPANSIRIFRHYFPNQEMNRNGALIAQDVIAALGDAPATHIELYNEGPSRLGQGLERYVAIHHEALSWLNIVRPDLTLIGYSFATGNVEQADWDYLRSVLFGGCKVVGWHHYWGAQSFTQWQALRYRTYWRKGDPQLILSEIGRDKVEGGRGGWMADGQAAESYARELIAYDAEISKDAYIIGATPFSSGPTQDWQSFNMDPVSPLLPTSSPPVLAPPGGPPVTTPQYSSPNHAARRLRTDGIVLHSTRGGSPTPQTEFDRTVVWFNDPSGKVSAHAVVGPAGQIAYPVAPDDVAWHTGVNSGSWNQTHLGIELAQSHLGDAILPSILEDAAKIVALWCGIYKIPLVWDHYHGLVEHYELDIQKSDIHLPFDRGAFLARVAYYATKGGLSDAQKSTVLGDLDMIWGMSRADTIKVNPAESERAIHERVVSIKVKLGLQ